MDPTLVLRIPGWLARIASHVCDVLHVTPFSFGHWELLRRDNLPAHNALAQLLGRAPRAVGTTMTESCGAVPAAVSAALGR